MKWLVLVLMLLLTLAAIESARSGAFAGLGVELLLVPAVVIAGAVVAKLVLGTSRTRHNQ